MPGEPSIDRSVADTTISGLLGLGVRRTEDSLDERLSQIAISRELGAPVEPATIGRFAVARLLGRGGQGCLYEGYDPELQRRVALKIPRFGAARADLGAEARALAQVRHRNLVTVYALEHCEGRAIVVMELVIGSPLSTWVVASRPSVARIVEVIARVGDGLDELHRCGLTHRDVKPANILVEPDGQPRLVDLGLAAMCGAPSAGAGTPSYAAPEQLRTGTADPAADQFGLAATLIAAIGEPARGQLPRRVRAAIGRALAHDPAQRHHDMASFVRALRDEPRRRVAAGIGAAAIATVAVLSAITLGGAGPCERDPQALQQQIDAARTGIDEHLASLPTAHGPEAIAPTARALTGYAARWSEAVELVCNAPGGTRWTGPRAQCLDDGAFELATVLTELHTLDAHTVAVAPRIAGGLPSPERCVDSELERLPPVLDHAEELELRRQLSIVDRRCRHGLSDDCAEQLDAIERDAVVRGIDACAWQPALSFTRASSAQYRGQPEAVAAALREAQWSSQRCGDDELELDARRILAEQLALVDGDVDGARDQLRAAEAILDRMGRPASQEIAVLASRASTMLALGEPQLAAEAATAARELHEGLRGGAPEERAQLLGLHSAALHELGEHARARALQEESLALREQQLGRHHPAIAHALANLAVAYAEVDLPHARALNRRAVEILAAAPDGHQLELAMCLTHQSGYDLDSGDDASARDVNDRALAVFAAADAADHPFAADALVVRAELLRRAGALDEALTTATRAVELLGRTRGPKDATTVAAQRGLERVQADHGRHGGGT